MVHAKIQDPLAQIRHFGLSSPDPDNAQEVFDGTERDLFDEAQDEQRMADPLDALIEQEEAYRASRRDYFAAAALTGLLASNRYDSPLTAVKVSLQVADAILKEVSA